MVITGITITGKLSIEPCCMFTMGELSIEQGCEEHCANVIAGKFSIEQGCEAHLNVIAGKFSMVEAADGGRLSGPITNLKSGRLSIVSNTT